MANMSSLLKTVSDREIKFHVGNPSHDFYLLTLL